MAANCFKKVKIDTSDWTPGEESWIYVRELSARERDEFENSLTSGTGKKLKFETKDVRARLAVLVCCDEAGARIFSPDDVDWLSQRPAGILSKIYDAAQQLNNFSDEDVEELVKNSTRIPG